MNNINATSNTNESPENIDVGIWLRLIRQLRLPKILGSLPDPRKESHTTYSLSTLVTWAFSVCAFRLPSKHALQTSLQDLSCDKQQGVLQLLGSQKIPHSSTVDEALGRIEYDHFNDVLLQLFDRLNEGKFFYNHPELIPNNAFYVGADGFWTHTYTAPHAVDEKGNNCCPYCLPRKYHAGTDKEFISWVHICVTFMLICDGITLPLYIYPLKATQVDTQQTDADLKQECELLATKEILSLLRKRYPRLPFVFLGDALYANRPFIKLLNSIKFGYILVLKENNLKTLQRRCDDLAKTEIYRKFYTHKETERKDGKNFYRQAAWFNQVAAGEEVYTHVLKFKEQVERQGKMIDTYEGMWLCSEKICKNNCMKRALQGRSRWNQEDVHNSCKNRGFNAKHDMARANPNLLLVWKLLLFIAFFTFEIFRCSAEALKVRKKRSWAAVFQTMLEQLIYIAWDVIAKTPILLKPRVQFRFHFGLGP